MQKIFITSIIALFMLSALQAQTTRVAMLEPLGSVSPMQKAIIRAKLAEALTNSGIYEALTRTDIDQLMNEFNFQHGGMVNDEQRQRLGQISGAELMCVTQLASEGNYFFVESRLVDLQSGRIVRTANQLMSSSPITALENGCVELARKLVGETAAAEASKRAATPQAVALSTPVATSSFRNGETYNPDGIELVFVEGVAAINDFYIGKYEITQAQWQNIMDSNPSRFRDASLPVESVSWIEAQMFLTLLNRSTGKNYRLPTEIEWQYAARGGTTSNCLDNCIFSGSNNINYVAWYRKNSRKRTHPVGTKQPNELGIYDMSGNVWEWCGNEIVNNRVFFRGGSFDNIKSQSYITRRRWNQPAYRSHKLGFRVVLPYTTLSAASLVQPASPAASLVQPVSKTETPVATRNPVVENIASNVPLTTDAPLLKAVKRNVYLYRDDWERSNSNERSLNKVYQQGGKLGKREVRSIMTANSLELGVYEIGRRNRNLGITFTSIGCAAVFYGISSYSAGYGYVFFSHKGYSKDRVKNEWVLAGTVGAISGVAMITTGMICMSKSKKHIRNSVNMHNSGINKTSNVEFDFGFTGNGMGLVMRF